MADELIEKIASSVDDILTKNSIYKIGNYGWLNEYDVDPEYVGHAIWQIEPPGKLDLDYPYSGKPLKNRPDDLDEAILVAGEDFSALMEASRLSIGLMLMHQELALNKINTINNEDQFFWLHYLDSILKLNIASDRLRKYFIIGATRLKVEDYEKKENRNKWFVPPFEQAKDILIKAGAYQSKFDKNLSKAASLACKVFKMIKKRNFIVHEIATRWAKANKKLINEQRDSFDREKANGFKKEDFSEYESLSFDDLKESHKIAEQKHKKEMKDIIKEVINWYQNLIDLSGYVFEIEYEVRRKTCS